MPPRVLVLRLALLIALAWATTGCVTIYQPLVSLQRPAVINPEHRNFDGLNLLLRCLPTDYTDSGDSEILCQNLRTLFTNQGAEVQVEVPEAELPPEEDGTKKPDLVIELTSKQLHSENSALQWMLCYASLTLIPATTEATFAQDVVLRDADGFLLGTDSLQGRFIRYFGLGYWGINALMDLIVRPKEEKLTGSAAKDDFSRDFYGQLSQLTFHARMRQEVLRNFDGQAPLIATPAAAVSPAPPAPARGPAPSPVRPSPAPSPAPSRGPAPGRPAPAPSPAPASPTPGDFANPFANPDRK